MAGSRKYTIVIRRRTITIIDSHPLGEFVDRKGNRTHQAKLSREDWVSTGGMLAGALGLIPRSELEK